MGHGLLHQSPAAGGVGKVLAGIGAGVSSAAAEAETTPYRRILAIVVALILYGSLYPWQFQPRHYGRNPLWILLHTWPSSFDRYVVWDVAVNITVETAGPCVQQN